MMQTFCCYAIESSATYWTIPCNSASNKMLKMYECLCIEIETQWCNITNMMWYDGLRINFLTSSIQLSLTLDINPGKKYRENNIERDRTEQQIVTNYCFS